MKHKTKGIKVVGELKNGRLSNIAAPLLRRGKMEVMGKNGARGGTKKKGGQDQGSVPKGPLLGVIRRVRKKKGGRGL